MGQNPLCTSGDLCRGREISAPALLNTLLHVLLLEGRSQLHPREGGDVQLGHWLLLGPPLSPRLGTHKLHVP